LSIRSSALARILNDVNSRLAAGDSISGGERSRVARDLLDGQIRSGRYAGLFARVETVPRDGVPLFTGEKLRTKGAVRHVLTHETTRLLRILAPEDAGVREALALVAERVAGACYAADFCVIGECAHAAVAFMRALAAGGHPDAENRLERHLRVLERRRDGKGRWRGFPFYYTILTLLEIDLPAADNALRYAGPACGRVARRRTGLEEMTARRREIIERALHRIGESSV
jgi:hypothetical protein